MTDGGDHPFATEDFEKLCGKPAEHIIGSRIGSLLPQGEIDRVTAGMRKSLPMTDGIWGFPCRSGRVRFPAGWPCASSGTTSRGRRCSTRIPATPGDAGTGPRCVYQIANASDHASTLDELYMSLHRIIGTVMPASNFYIAIFDAAGTS